MFGVCRRRCRYGHSALTSLLLRVDESRRPIAEGPLFLRDSRGTEQLLRHGVEPVLRGLPLSPEQEVSAHVASDLRQLALLAPLNFDLAAANIQVGSTCPSHG